MGELHLTITASEQQYLLELIAEELKDMRVEEHRTRAPIYRAGVLHREELAESLLQKLQQLATVQ